MSAPELVQGVAEVLEYGLGVRREGDGNGDDPEQGVAQLQNPAGGHITHEDNSLETPGQNREPMKPRRDPLQIAVALAVYVSFYLAADLILSRTLPWVGGAFAGGFVTVLASALFANWLALRIYENLGLGAIGLRTNHNSLQNLGFGILGGAGGACLVLAPALVLGAAHLAAVPDPPAPGTLSFVSLGLAAGSSGEEILFRGYGFQLLMASAGPFASIVPVGVIFALLHTGNPNATWLGIANTAGFGILFGYAFYRSRDLWLPIGLHFGWNFTLPLFGVNVSGLRMEVTGHQMVWTAGSLWSGGEYGPEASLLTSGALALLFLYVWKAPFRRQVSPLTDPSAEGPLCEPSPPSLL